MAAGSVLVGCRSLRDVGKSDGKYDLLTAELRTRERELREAEAELNHLRLLTQTYQRQGSAPVLDWAPPSFHHETGTPTLPLREVTLGSGTGGVDADNQPGDESLMVVVVPKDVDGTAIKIPARLVVSVLEISREGMKTPIGRWEIPAESLRKTWKTGLIGSGYFVPLRWDQTPTQERLRIVARLTTLDQREYEADKDVTVRPLPGLAPRLAPTVVPPPSRIPPPTVPDSPRGVEELPPPAATLQPARPIR